MDNIKVKYNGFWTPADSNQCLAFQNHKNNNLLYREIPTTTNGITIYRENNDSYLPTYMNDGTNILPIADWNDVKVFLLDIQNVDWVAARNYQTFAYFDFIYDNKQKKTYFSKYSSHLFFHSAAVDIVEIPIDNLPPNIIFNMSRNENNSVYYERNDANSTRVRICDNSHARNGYRGFWNRLTMDTGIISQPSINVPNPFLNLQIPTNMELIKTDIEEDQCILCFDYKKNLLFNPCNHNIICSNCYPKLEKKSECPVCKQIINSLSSN
jgi:hypothetical protein